MATTTLKERIQAFHQLGIVLNELLQGELHATVSKNFAERFNYDVSSAFHHNGWFDENSVRKAIEHLLPWLNNEALEAWVKPYTDSFANSNEKTVGLIMAGNLPLVGFHDMLAILISGNKLLGKTSSKDPLLPKLILEILADIEPKLASCIELTTERFGHLDAVIATGSNNSMRYFEHYFGKYPHILRGNRNSIAILDGNETKEELNALGTDIFTFYGLGCRNVTNLYVPKGYNFKSFFEAIEPLNEVGQNKKYANNYEYNRTVWLLNSEQGLLDNNFLIIKPEEKIGSPIGTLFYHEYENMESLNQYLASNENRIQCIVSKNKTPFGTTQQPGLSDYADNVNSLEFLSSL